MSGIGNQTREQVLKEFDHLVPEATYYRLAADLIDLSGKILEEADGYNDPGLRDLGFQLADQAREMVRENIAYRDLLDCKLNSKQEDGVAVLASLIDKQIQGKE
jgi:hypothetical protein